MTGPPRSIRDVVEQLKHEFEHEASVSAVTEVVTRLSTNGAVSLPVLAAMARSELSALTAPELH
jgi:hypothetical protein